MIYTDNEIAEFKKMGYDVSTFGDVHTETKLQKTLRVKNGIIANTMKKPLVKKVRFSDKVGVGIISTTRTHRWSDSATTDAERVKRGLATTKQPGIDYNLLPDNTKVCRCCQDRKPKEFFGNHQSAPDKLMYVCRDCNHLRGVDYKENKKSLSE